MGKMSGKPKDKIRLSGFEEKVKQKAAVEDT
jgi:hypothetical protein